MRQEKYDGDGLLLSDISWRAGKRHGRSVEYWINGALRSEGTFGEGKGKLTGYFLGGQKQFEEEYVNDKKVGRQTYWHENGQKRLECTVNEAGRYDGSYISYYQGGQKEFQLDYRKWKNY